ncbi:MAG TPA: PAS domain S-box protein [Candidatus Limnocylindria bacterium]|nr:PAS domain S-box protein [Candidatus Limnocylindria bacterium]
MSTEPNQNPEQRVSQEWERVEQAERGLWRKSLLLLVALALGLALATWEMPRSAPLQFTVLPVGLVILVALFGFYVWSKTHELRDLRALLRELHEAASAPPTEAQFEKLLHIVSRSQHGYRELIDNLDHAVFTFTPSGHFQVANRYLAQMLGCPFQDLIGHPFEEFIAEPARADVERAFPQLLQLGTWTGRIPLRLVKSRELRYFDCRFQAISTHGQLTSISGWARDVTSQHESEIRFQELFESLREGILFTSPEGEILDANPALVRMLGFEDKEQLKSHNFRDFYVDPSRRDAIVQEMRETGSAQDSELELRRKDGAHIQCLASGFAIRDTFGRLVRLQGTLVDVTERFEIKRRLHEEQEFVRRLIDNFPDLIVVFDREAHFTYVSPRVQEILGSNPDEFVGHAYHSAVHPEDQNKTADVFRRLITGEAQSIQTEFRAPHSDGSWRLLRASSGPLVDADGKISGIVSSVRDITESNRFEQQMAQKEKFASMGQTMAGAAHELNNPLTAILGVSDLLRERATDDATRRQVEIVLQQARRAAGIVQNLLAFSRPPALGRAPVRLDELVQRALQFQQASLRQKNITVDFQPPATLPAIVGDPKLLTQVFLNIITNAEQAISSVRDHGILKISLESSGGNQIATFADNGPGVSPENAGKLFDPFFTTKRPGGGSGLGLTISLAVVKEHGGRIEVQSSSPGGATFRVVLPAPVENLSQPSTPAAGSRTVPALPHVLRGHSALVVDDEDSIREIVQEGLTARGMAVEGAASAEEALTHLAKNAYDVVLCDFNLPGLNGEQLFSKLRAQANVSPPRFVFMTGDLLEPDVIASFEGSGAHLMQKPFHVAALATLLSELLQPQPAKMG